MIANDKALAADVDFREAVLGLAQPELLLRCSSLKAAAQRSRRPVTLSPGRLCDRFEIGTDTGAREILRDLEAELHRPPDMRGGFSLRHHPGTFEVKGIRGAVEGSKTEPAVGGGSELQQPPEGGVGVAIIRWVIPGPEIRRWRRT